MSQSPRHGNGDTPMPQIPATTLLTATSMLRNPAMAAMMNPFAAMMMFNPQAMMLQQMQLQALAMAQAQALHRAMLRPGFPAGLAPHQLTSYSSRTVPFGLATSGPSLPSVRPTIPYNSSAAQAAGQSAAHTQPTANPPIQVLLRRRCRLRRDLTLNICRSRSLHKPCPVILGAGSETEPSQSATVAASGRA